MDLPDLPFDEAADAGPCLDGDLNHHWTAFGPTNVELHRGNAYIEPSDAGAAAERARRIDLGRIDVVERRAALLVDAGRAYAQWGKLERAYLTSEVHTLAAQFPSLIGLMTTGGGVIDRLLTSSFPSLIGLMTTRTRPPHSSGATRFHPS
ncbi:hypothetical protein [Nocardiopsis composta]|uniref:hypothetical protein n=1 Tax=Nocardiopsis composta TaxID=157465 RepID=UPI003B3B96B7